jgi:hypothetical protein
MKLGRRWVELVPPPEDIEKSITVVKRSPHLIS